MYLFYFLISNTGTVIPYKRFEEISKSYTKLGGLSAVIRAIRPVALLNGFYIGCVSRTGYQSFKNIDIGFEHDQ